MLQPSVHRSAATSGASAASTKAAGRMVSCVRARECCSRDNLPAPTVLRSAAAAAAPGMEFSRSKAEAGGRQDSGVGQARARPGQVQVQNRHTPHARQLRKMPAELLPLLLPLPPPRALRRVARRRHNRHRHHSTPRSLPPTQRAAAAAAQCRRVRRRAVRLLQRLLPLVRVVLAPERLQRRVCGPAGTPTYGARRTIRRQDVTLMAPRDADRVPSRAGAAARSRQEAPPEAARDKGRQGQVPRTQSRHEAPQQAARERHQGPLRCAPRYRGGSW